MPEDCSACWMQAFSSCSGGGGGAPVSSDGTPCCALSPGADPSGAPPWAVAPRQCGGQRNQQDRHYHHQNQQRVTLRDSEPEGLPSPEPRAPSPESRGPSPESGALEVLTVGTRDQPIGAAFHLQLRS